jgi:8-oxo-dGTP pyrophosphatase MutT (NUDIX family)
MVRDQLSSPRDRLLRLLRNHEAQKLEAHEDAMTKATIRFIETYAESAERSLLLGHLTGSAWVVDRTRTRVLLTHHRKLEKWLQLGGHADGEFDLAEVALREAQEESGLKSLRLVSREIFDVDRHRIPARTNEPEHWHYDVRFLIEADADERVIVTNESKALEWIDLARVEKLNAEESVLRMVRKTPKTQ